jgi:hypothetical protein
MTVTVRVVLNVVVVVFTVGPADASIQLPQILSGAITDRVATPGFDATDHPDETERFFKISWEMPSSLPWLVSTIVIVRVAMVEELRMETAVGEASESFRQHTPFLLPLPARLVSMIAAPMRWVIHRPWPDSGSQTAIVIAAHTAIHVAASVPFVVVDWPPRIGWWGFPSKVWPLAATG